ncbi:hypothetical protein D3C83_06830 [compost metagenome]
MYSVFRAPAIDSAKKRSAAVLPSVGDVYSRPAAVAPPGAGSMVARPVNMTPVASIHAAANAACSCRTAAPSKRTFVSRHDPLLRPSPSHLSSMPKPPVQPMRLSMTTPRTCERFCARCSVEIRIGRNGSTTTPASRSASRCAGGMSTVPKAS